MHELIGDITQCILFAWVLGLLAHFSRQPLILAYFHCRLFHWAIRHGMGQVPGTPAAGGLPSCRADPT
jgi:hypothetical protein